MAEIGTRGRRMGGISSALSAFFGTLVDQSSMRLAMAGDGDGNVDVPDRPNYVFVRLGGADGPVAQMHVSVVHPNDGDYVYAIRENPTRSAGWRHVFWLRAESDPALPAPIAGT